MTTLSVQSGFCSCNLDILYPSTVQSCSITVLCPRISKQWTQEQATSCKCSTKRRRGSVVPSTLVPPFHHVVRTTTDDFFKDKNGRHYTEHSICQLLSGSLTLSVITVYTNNTVGNGVIRSLSSHLLSSRLRKTNIDSFIFFFNFQFANCDCLFPSYNFSHFRHITRQ